MKTKLVKTLLFCLISCPAFAQTISHAQHIIVFVWDGLRPDSVTQQDTPNLLHLMKNGTEFTDNHSSYPTFTMMNAASFATGDRAGKTGFFGNTLWHPGIHGSDSAGNPVDFNQPIFTEDYKILEALNDDNLFFVNTLFNAAHQKQLTTSTVGKSGPAFIQDYLSGGMTLDEKHVNPLYFAKQLQNANYPLPKYSPINFKPGELELSSDNGSPTDFEKINRLIDGVTSNPADQSGSPFNHSNQYLMNIYLNELISKQMPALSMVWMRNPDSTEHDYGPGTFNYHHALAHNDMMLGLLLEKLKDHHLDNTTDIIIVSDHAHSTVSGSLTEFPLRAIHNNQVTGIDPQGYSVSGDVRTADLLTKAGFHAYDGRGCVYDPVLSGIKKDNSLLYPVLTDTTGKICGEINAKYITPAYQVPKTNLPTDAVIIASNGGSDYFYIPSHNKQLAEKLIVFLASHKQFDSIFVDSTRYGKLKGTIPLKTIGIENPQGRSPDIIVGFSYDANAKINDMPGIEFSDSANTRGMHGSFSPVDVHNFLIAFGPDFRKHFIDTLPTGNIDVAPTIAYLLNLDLSNTDGRILWEALIDTKDKHYKVRKQTTYAAAPLDNLSIYNALNEKTLETRFTTMLQTKVLSEGNEQYYYFDWAKGVRK